MVRQFSIWGRPHNQDGEDRGGLLDRCWSRMFLALVIILIYTVLLSMACIPLSHVFHQSREQEQNKLRQRQQQQQHNDAHDIINDQLNRNIMYIPPGPVAPFRVKPAPQKNNEQNHLDDDIVSQLESSADSFGTKDPTYDLIAQMQNDGIIFSDHTSFSSVSTSSNTSSDIWWEPEGYPDPWANPILCGGALAGTPVASLQSQIKNPLLLCDPDHVLDRETFEKISVQLRGFAEIFAPKVDDTGADNNGQLLADANKEVDNDESQEEDTKPSQDSLPTSDEDNTNRKLSTNHPRITISTPLRQLKSTDSVGGLFFPTSHHHPGSKRKKELVKDYKMEVAIALVQKINLPAILREDSYFFYSDQDDLVNDAAQYFARYIHDTWAKRLAQEQKSVDPPTNIVLIFVSIIDRICYISSGSGFTSILPWWRLEHVVQDIKLDLQIGHTGEALSAAIDELTELLLEGPPSFMDRANDFFQRFGVILLFTVFTFLFSTWGECRDRRKRMFFAEKRSRMTAAEKEKAMSLQKQFQNKSCPICLEPFDLSPNKNSDTDTKSLVKEEPFEKLKLKRVDSFGVPLIGTDSRPIKLLRCGHIFDATCWQSWIDSGSCSNPWICPVCRQDVGRPKRGSRRNAEGGDRDESSNQESSLFARIVANTPEPSMSLRLVNHSNPDYNSIQSRAPLSNPTSQTLHPILGLSAFPPTEALSEETPLFEQMA